MSKLIRLTDFARRYRSVFFNRRELNRLLSLYSRQVARGLWRDYAIDHRPGMAVFSVFRHSQDRPIYAIAKCIGADRSVDFLVFSGRRRLKTGKALDEVLEVFEARLRVVS